MDERIEALLPFYALDAVTDEERQQVETYLEQDPRARERLAEYASAADALPYAAAPLEPPAAIKTSLMERVNADLPQSAPTQESRKQSDSWWNRLFGRPALPLAGGLALVAIALLVVWAGSLRSQLNQLDNENQQLQAAVNAQEELVASLQDDLEAQARQLQTLNASNEALQSQLLEQESTLALFSQRIEIAGTEAAPQATAELLHTGGETAILTVSRLNQLPAQSTYQFWLIDDIPHSAGLFVVDENGEGRLVVEADSPISSFAAFGVSIEPDGGSSEPTGDIVLLSG